MQITMIPMIITRISRLSQVLCNRLYPVHCTDDHSSGCRAARLDDRQRGNRGYYDYSGSAISDSDAVLHAFEGRKETTLQSVGTPARSGHCRYRSCRIDLDYDVQYCSSLINHAML